MWNDHFLYSNPYQTYLINDATLVDRNTFRRFSGIQFLLFCTDTIVHSQY